uniref:RING-type domain-containing protein n=1 Tax=viral metagenome TaxID=1070528 RepID=A0A6C0LTW2_9ZZZZ
MFQMNTIIKPDTCEICADKFTCKRVSVECPNCLNTACSECYKTFILNSHIQPQCLYPDCKANWSRKFMYDNFSKGFITGPLKKHREGLYLEREKALLPATQATVIRTIQAENISMIFNKYRKLKKQCTDIYQTKKERLVYEREKINQGYIILNSTRRIEIDIPQDGTETWKTMVPGNYGDNSGYTIESVIPRIHEDVKNIMLFSFQRGWRAVDRKQIETGNKLDDILILAAISIYNENCKLLVPHTKKWYTYITKEIKQSLTNELRELSRTRNDELNGLGHVNKQHVSVQRFIRSCTRDTCRGFLSTGWKCGLCSDHVCSKCHISLGINVSPGHECNDDDIATARLIKSESKPCPGCHINISKIDGCDQMWCTQCNTGWDWKSGRIETKIHNPHYFEYLRKLEVSGIPDRNPLEVRCGREINGDFINIFSFILIRIEMPNDGVSHITRIISGFLHFNRYHMNNYVDDNGDTEYLRIAYMRDLITEEQFKKRVQIAYKKLDKETEIRDVLTMFNQSVVDILYRCRDELDNAQTLEDTVAYKSTLEEITVLEEYVNECLYYISLTYQSVIKKVSLIGVYDSDKDAYIERGLYTYKPKLVKQT